MAMKKAIALAMVAAVSSVNGECFDDYNQQITTVGTNAVAKCAALRQFDLCVEALDDADDTKVSMQKLVDTFAATADCEDILRRDDVAEPTLTSASNNLEMWTGPANDVIVGRRGTGMKFSLWNVSTDVNALKSNMDDLAEQVSDSATEIKTDVQSKLKDFNDNVIGQLQGQSQATATKLKSVGEAVDRVESSLTEATAVNTKSINAVNSRLSAQLKAAQDTLVKVKECNDGGKLLGKDEKCAAIPGNTETNFKVCNKDSLGATRFNVNQTAFEACVIKRKKYAFVVLVDLALGQSPEFAAKNGQELKDAGITKSGLFWLQPDGDDKAAQTYCDMEFNGGGYCLVNVGYIHEANGDARNRGLLNMNRPNGYQWAPNNRASNHMLINLPSGAVNLAKGAKSMIMAAGNNPSSGGIDQYKYVYEINYANTAKFITFANGNRYNGGCGGNGFKRQTMTSFTVKGLKGDKGSWTRRSTRESLMISWSDTYPAGYGFTAQQGGQDCTYTWGDGPFFPSIHSGDGHGYTGGSRFSSPPDVKSGRLSYTHQGWYRSINGHYNNGGQTSIWFR